MTPAAELWAAVVKHCATGRGYDMELKRGCLFLRKWNAPLARGVEPSPCGNWYLIDSEDKAIQFCISADEAVRAALRIVAPSTEPNVSC